MQKPRIWRADCTAEGLPGALEVYLTEARKAKLGEGGRMGASVQADVWGLLPGWASQGSFHASGCLCSSLQLFLCPLTV